jgi:hypothetical protein
VSLTGHRGADRRHPARSAGAAWEDLAGRPCGSVAPATINKELMRASSIA